MPQQPKVLFVTICESPNVMACCSKLVFEQHAAALADKKVALADYFENTRLRAGSSVDLEAPDLSIASRPNSLRLSP